MIRLSVATLLAWNVWWWSGSVDASMGPIDTVIFRDVAAEVGLTFQHANGASGQYHLPEIMGAGGALFDFDVDGDLDVLLLQGGALAPGISPDRRAGHRLFRNDLGGKSIQAHPVRMVDITDRAGFATGDYGMGVATGDYDGDGDPDLYLTNYGANRLYRNNRDGTFTDVTGTAGDGLGDPRWSSSASFADYDADGDLDLFVVNYVDFTVGGSKVCHDPVGIRDYCGPLQFRPVPDRLFRTNGDSTFTDVSEPAGITRAFGSGLGVAAADFNGDRRLDFFVANDAMSNQLWINKGDGTFEDGALLAGVAVNASGRVEGSMGVAAGDSDNDGDLELFVTNITGESHAFYENLGAGRFEDRRLMAGLGAATRPYTGFGTDWFDFDNDGLLDLFVANGAVTIIDALRGDASPFRQPNQLLRNLGRNRFRDATADAGPSLALSEVSRGAAFGDIDNDGDIDILVTNNAGPVRLLRNESTRGNHWLQVALEGGKRNRHGLGARVGVVRGDGSVIWRRARADGSYLTASDPRVHFGLGAASRFQRVAVEWPDGSKETWSGLRADRFIVLKQHTGVRLP